MPESPYRTPLSRHERTADRRLIDAILAGEEFAQRRLESAVRYLAKSVGFRYGISHDAVDDLALAVLALLFEENCSALRNFAFRCRLEQWLGVVVLNAARDQHRKLARDRDRDRRQAALSLALTQESPHEREFEKLAAKLDIEAALTQVEPELARLIRLRYLRGFTLQDLATLSGQTVPGISSKIYRGLDALRALLEGPTEASEPPGESYGSAV